MKYMKKTLADRVFDVFDVAIMLVLLVIFAWPLWFVIIASISNPDLVVAGKVLFIPKGLTLGGYKLVLEYKQIWTGYGNSLFYMVVGTASSMVMSIGLAYLLSEKTFALRNSIPGELKEAATLDGANAASYLVRIVLPLSKPVFAVVGLYYAVAYWNNYTKGLYYIYDRKLLPLQNVLRDLLLSTELMSDLTSDPELAEQAYQQAQSMKYGVIIVAALPMMILYPFIQKYFVKGVMVGSVKG